MAGDIRHRTRPTARLTPRVTTGTAAPDRTIVIVTGRGNTKVTAAEARAVAAELVAAAEAAEKRDGKQEQPTQRSSDVRDRDGPGGPHVGQTGHPVQRH